MSRKLTKSTGLSTSILSDYSENALVPIMSEGFPAQYPTRDGYSSLRSCAGCARRFVPAGPQRYCSHECYSGTLRTPIIPRFWAKVNKTETCWLWTAATIRGYGQIASVVNGKRTPVYAHRFSWELVHGPVPSGLWVLHHCDVPLCVNPEHLFLGTHTDNMRDASVKGRLSVAHTSRHLTPQDRLDIFHASRERGTGSALARDYGVSKTCISLIRRGRFVGAPLQDVQPVAQVTDQQGQFPNQLSYAV